MSEQNANLKDQFLVPPGAVIDKRIYNFLIILMGNIFLNPKLPEKYKKVEEFLKNTIKFINENNIKDQEKYINTEYSNKNFKNILDFVKRQNKILSGDILEGILILIFSYAFKAKKVNTFGEFIYRNINKDEKYNYDYKLENPGNFDLAKWFQKGKLKPVDLQSIENLLGSENSINNDQKRNKFKRSSPLYYLLYEIQKLKYINVKNKNKKIDKYIYSGNFQIQKIEDINFTANFKQYKLIRYFFISVFIYYQNKYSPLMKYTIEYHNEEEEKKEGGEEEEEDEDEKIELAVIPFDYNLNEASLENRFANTVISPSRIEPRINKISMSQNKLEERGFFELSKALIFNKNIKKCFFDTSLLKSYYLEYLNLGMGLFDNYTLEELNLSNNFMNKDIEEYLSKLITHLKNLKTINLSCNDLKRGASSFFIMLNKLYRQKKTKLENLILNKCNLDNSSFYELGELLKSKYCKLKRLYLNNNTIPENTHFLKKLKKNKTLTQIYLNKSNFNEDNTNDIMRLISNTNIETLYLNFNKITDFKDCLRIISRTELILNKEEEEITKQNDKENNQKFNNIKAQSSFLINLNLSDNNCFNKNTSEIEILSNIIDKTTLYTLDLSHILYGNVPERYEKNQENNEYRAAVDKLQEKLDKERENYEIIIDNKKCVEVDIKEGDNFINKYKKELEKHDFDEDKIKQLKNLLNTKDEPIVKDSRAKYPLFLREKAKEFIKDEIVKAMDENEFTKFVKDKLIINNPNGDNKTVNMELYKSLENFLLYNMFVKTKKIDYDNLIVLKQNQKLSII